MKKSRFVRWGGLKPSFFLGFSLLHVLRVLREALEDIAHNAVGERAEFLQDDGFGFGLEDGSVRLVAADGLFGRCAEFFDQIGRPAHVFDIAGDRMVVRGRDKLAVLDLLCSSEREDE